MFSFWKTKKDKFTQELEHFLGFEVQKINLYHEAFAHPSSQLAYNYQRLEFLGDAVLSTVVAAYLFDKYPDLAEGELSKLRTKLVNKQILKEVAIKLHLDQWIQHQLSATELEKSSVYCDVVESLIGAIYLDKGMKVAEMFVKEKIIQQLAEVKDIEDTDYKSQLIQLSQKYKWQLKFNIESVSKENNESVFCIGVYINNEKISEGKHYSKKQAEQMASQEALKVLNIGV